MAAVMPVAPDPITTKSYELFKLSILVHEKLNLTIFAPLILWQSPCLIKYIFILLYFSRFRVNSETTVRKNSVR